MLLAVALLFFISCTSAPKAPDCINQSAFNAELSWGNLENGDIDTVFRMKMNGEIFSSLNNFEKPIKIADSDSLCEILREMGRLIIEVQILNVPSETNHFIEYKNEERDYYFRSVWDPRFTNESNKDFRLLYKRLVDLTEQK